MRRLWTWLQSTADLTWWRRRSASLAWQMVQSHLIATVVVLVVASLIFWAALVREAEKHTASRLTQIEQTARATIDRAYDPPQQVLPRLQGALQSAEVTLLTQMPPGRLAGIWHDEILLLSYYRHEHGQAFFEIRSRSPMQEQTRRVLGHFLTILAVGAGSAILLSWWLGRRLARPLGELARATRAVAEGSPAERLEPTGLTELDDLAASFNQMAAHLAESFRQLRTERDLARRFAGDAAHELKTPLTALKTYAEVAQSAGDGRRQQAMDAVMRQVQRLEHLVGGLVQLATLGEGVSFDLVRGDLRQYAERLVPACEEMARQFGHRLQYEAADSFLPVRLEPRLLELIVTNLVENACKFMPSGGEITIDVGATAGEAFIAVADTGPGIPAAELPHIFERFRRGMETQQVPGSGLGLSIVGRAAERLGGRMDAHSRPGEGSQFALLLRLLD